MGMISEFKEFALRGNVIDLAVGVVIGGAFGKIVSSLVNDLITPVISLFTGSADFKSLSVTLRTGVLDAEGKETVPALLLTYGSFIQSVIDFTLIALVIFFAVKAINRLRRQEQAAPPAPAPAEPSAEAKLLAEIRDLLSKR